MKNHLHIKLAVLLVGLSFALTACSATNKTPQTPSPVALGEVATAWSQTDRYRVDGKINLPEFLGNIQLQVDMPDRLYLLAQKGNGDNTYEVVKSGRNYFKRVGGEAWSQVEGVDELSFNHRVIVDDFVKTPGLSGQVVEQDHLFYTEFTRDETGKLAGKWVMDVDQTTHLPVHLTWSRGGETLADFKVYDYGATDFLIVAPEI
jgi:hypothetical protein